LNCAWNLLAVHCLVRADEAPARWEGAVRLPELGHVLVLALWWSERQTNWSLIGAAANAWAPHHAATEVDSALAKPRPL
jgi:hypothetical protein